MCIRDRSLDSALGEGQIAQRERECGQTSLLDMMGDDETASDFRQKPELPEWPEKEILAFEKETLGLYVSSHPLARYAETLRRFSNASVDDIPRLREGQQVVVGGVLATIKHHTTKSGKHMAFLTLDTLEGSCEVTVFSDVFAQRAGLLIPDAIVMIPARVNFRNDEAGLLADDIIQIEEKLATARERQRMLMQRYERAEKVRQVEQHLRRYDTSDAMARFEAFDERLSRVDDGTWPARKSSLEQEFEDLLIEDEIDKELESLKKQSPSAP